MVHKAFTYTFPRTALATATAGAYQQRARALLDPGTTISLITSRLAGSLKAKRVRTSTDISGLTGMLTSDHLVEVDLGPAFTSGGKVVTIKAHVIDSIVTDCPDQDLEAVKQMPFLKGRQLADPELGISGKIDLLLGVTDCNRCTEDGLSYSPDKCLIAQNTIFGWAVGGSVNGKESNNVCLTATASDKRADDLMQRLWAMDEVQGDSSNFTSDEQQAVAHFKDTHQRDADGRYRDQLPRKCPTPILGASRSTAQKRFVQNERSLRCKGNWDAFALTVSEYDDLGHSEKVPPSDLKKEPSDVFYLPMHGVSKSSSTTTKLRVVFDASAKTSIAKPL